MTQPRDFNNRRHASNNDSNARHGTRHYLGDMSVSGDYDMSALTDGNELREIIVDYLNEVNVSFEEFLEHFPRLYQQYAAAEDSNGFGDLEDDSLSISDSESAVFRLRRNLELLLDREASATSISTSTASAPAAAVPTTRHVNTSVSTEQMNLRRRAFLNFTDDGDSSDEDEGAHSTFSLLLQESLAAGRQAASVMEPSAIREIPLRRILPRSPPASPIPNLATAMADGLRHFRFFNERPPAVPSRLGRPTIHPESNSILQMHPPQPTSTTNLFDPNGSWEECKSPQVNYVEETPLDRNNDLPITSEFLRRYGHQFKSSSRISFEDRPER